MMHNIDRHLYSMIAKALKCEGTYNPAKVLPHIEEDLTKEEYHILGDFLKWCHVKQKPFGHGNYNTRFLEWRRTKEGRQVDLRLGKQKAHNRLATLLYPYVSPDDENIPDDELVTLAVDRYRNDRAGRCLDKKEN